MARAVPLALAAMAVVSVSAISVSPLAAQRLKLSVPLAELERRLRADSNDAAAHYNVALGYWSAKRYDDAERALTQALAIEPRFAAARLALAYLPFARRPKLWKEILRDRVPDDWRPAVEQFDREYRHAFLVDPMVDMRIMGAGEPLAPDLADMRDVFGEAFALYVQGFTDCEEGRYQDCFGRFQAMIREIDGDRFPDRIPLSALWYQALAAGHLGRWQEAAANLQQSLDRMLDWEKKLEEEKEKGKDFVRTPLRSNEYRYFLAFTRQHGGDAIEAVRLYREALEKDLSLYAAHVQMANILEAQKRYPEAVAERHRAVNANPDDPSLPLDLGVTLGKAGRFAEAEQALAQAIERNPRDTRTLFWLGICQVQLGKDAEAKESLSRFVATAPKRYERQIAMAQQRLAQLR
ncbi:MAG TPA: tetratricopeptide repeat protein [Gemmatimonadales bacterium]|nr:tetratricopeptide repeat protein [Gemmatimonadales bacterium]